MTSRRRRALLVTFVLLLIAGATTLSLVTRLSPTIKARAVAALNARLQSEVDLASLRIAVFPRPAISGEGLTLRHHGRTDVPPLIELGSYSASAGLIGLFSSPMRLRSVELDRLEISIPPGGLRAPEATGSTATPVTPSVLSATDERAPRLVIDEIIARAARLEIVPANPNKLPRVFDIHDLTMKNVGEGRGSPFEAQLTNPKPHGEIRTHGTFGPWRAENPRQTPLAGEYVFSNARLDTIKGIGGTLSSTGRYSGVLERVAVQGETTTPDFSVDVAAQPVPLTTRFEAVVDGTNGDTFLDRVEARVLETVILARGAVVRDQDVKGRRIELEVTITDGRIEDVLKLGVKTTTPIMTGRMRLNTTFLLPAGDASVIDRLELAGRFTLDQARFTNVNIQERINTLSQRGKGIKDQEGPSVVSKLSGRFALRDGRIRFSELSFGVPGAIVELAGDYNIKDEQLDFRGHLLLDATLAQTTGGVKAILAWMAQPLFRRPGGGSKLPIRITGPREKPEFGLDMRRALLPG